MSETLGKAGQVIFHIGIPETMIWPRKKVDDYLLYFMKLKTNAGKCNRFRSLYLTLIGHKTI